MMRKNLPLTLFLAGALVTLSCRLSNAAEPMLDTSLFGTLRIGALNAVKAGNFTQALQEEQSALKIAQDEHGPTSLSLIPLLKDVGILQWHLARYREAEESFKWSLALVEKNLGPDDPRVADSLDPLAALYFDLNRLEEAQLLERRALALREGSGATQALSNSRELLGRIRMGLKQYAEARSLFQKAQKDLTKLSKPDPAFGIALLKDLAGAYGALQDVPQAQGCLEKALETAQKNFSPDSPEVTDATAGLADFYRSRGAGDKSRALYESALKAAMRSVGTNYDYQALPNMKRLAGAYEGSGDPKSAIRLWEKVIRIETSVLGPQHPRVALALIQRSQAESEWGQKEKAKSDLKEALVILEQSFQGDHPLVLQAKGLLDELSGK